MNKCAHLFLYLCLISCASSVELPPIYFGSYTNSNTIFLVPILVHPDFEGADLQYFKPIAPKTDPKKKDTQEKIVMAERIFQLHNDKRPKTIYLVGKGWMIFDYNCFYAWIKEHGTEDQTQNCCSINFLYFLNLFKCKNKYWIFTLFDKVKQKPGHIQKTYDDFVTALSYYPALVSIISNSPVLNIEKKLSFGYLEHNLQSLGLKSFCKIEHKVINHAVVASLMHIDETYNLTYVTIGNFNDGVLTFQLRVSEKLAYFANEQSKLKLRPAQILTKLLESFYFTLIFNKTGLLTSFTTEVEFTRNEQDRIEILSDIMGLCLLTQVHEFFIQFESSIYRGKFCDAEHLCALVKVFMWKFCYIFCDTLFIKSEVDIDELAYWFSDLDVIDIHLPTRGKKIVRRCVTIKREPVALFKEVRVEACDEKEAILRKYKRLSLERLFGQIQ